jgi:hypothetical protein
MPTDCSHNTDPLKLVREGTSQDGRLPDALDPTYAPVNERTVAHGMVFARSYAGLLKHFDEKTNAQTGDWVPFFGNDVSVQLALAAIEDVDTYKANTQAWFDYLNRLENKSSEAQLKHRFGFLYASVATLAQQLDLLKQGLPAEIALKGTLQNLIKSQLAPAFRRLIAYYKAGVIFNLINAAVPSPTVQILRRPVVNFADVLNEGLSADWSQGLAWAAYVGGIAEDASVYGQAPDVFGQINHCSTHNLFTSVFDQFLKVFARVVGAAKAALNATLTDWDKHEPHYALYLAFLRLLEYARASSNTLTQRHLDFYYRGILRLEEKGAEPGRVHLLAELAKQVTSREFKAGEPFKAGKDAQGREAFFANTNDFIANQAKVAALKTIYRHGDEPVGTSVMHKGRLHASPVANSDDGLGAPLTSADQSWHPFYNKAYADGALAEIRMPKADVGFAIASHYLLMAEGPRHIKATVTVSGYSGASDRDFRDDIRCLLTTEKGWLELGPDMVNFGPSEADAFQLSLKITGADAPITPYSAKTHGYAFPTDLPMLLVKLNQNDARPYAYSALQSVVVTDITLSVSADNLKALTVSNDLGPVDSSRPFQPFGPSPVSGSSLILGSKEIFQKKLLEASVSLTWLTDPPAYASTSTTASLPNVHIYFLSEGQWSEAHIPATTVGSTVFSFTADLHLPVLDEPDFGANEFYGTQSRQGFAKLTLDGDFGQTTYQSDLLKYLRKDGSVTDPPQQPLGPMASALSMSYTASSALHLNTSTENIYEDRPGQFFHLAPFGAAEQHPYLSSGKPVHLLPQFDFVRDNAAVQSEAELYVGIEGLKPPQNLSLLFQVAAGTSNPMVPKPKPHIHWFYLKNNQWMAFAENAVQDGTGELLNSGVVTFAVPRDATSDNTLLPSGLFWIRAAVHEGSDAVCRLQLVAAQAMQAVFVDHGNAPEFGALPLSAGTIKKLDKPDSAVKAIHQPFASFGQRGAEQPKAFYTRISERLRHKDRGVDLWDYERLILEAFPQIYKVKCLNHTHYDEGIYRELAPGHVTLVTIPSLQSQNLRDPLKPYTSLDVLEQIQAYLEERTSCFARLHVKNPQFEEVRVRFKLRLYDGFDEAYYSDLLKQAITRFLSPWAFATGGTPSFGGKIYKSVLIDFIEDQPYVDYVSDFQVFQDIGGVQGTGDLDELGGSTAVSILVSAPAAKHEITIIDEALQIPSGESCACEA